MNEKELKKLLKYWQKELKISDWKIHFRFMDGMKYDGVAYCKGNPLHRSAVIEIQRPENRIDLSPYDGEEVYNFYTEIALVHELLHLIIQPHRTGKKMTEEESFLLESSINLLDHVLVSLKYGVYVKETYNKKLRYFIKELVER